MKWKTYIPDDGDQKIVTFFAFLPVSVYNVGISDKFNSYTSYKEVRWLEKVTIRKMYKSSFYESPEWVNIQFI